MRVGFGYDLHPLVPGRPLILGGIHIPFKMGLEGHSDADVLCHAIADGTLSPDVGAARVRALLTRHQDRIESGQRGPASADVDTGPELNERLGKN